MAGNPSSSKTAAAISARNPHHLLLVAILLSFTASTTNAFVQHGAAGGRVRNNEALQLFPLPMRVLHNLPIATAIPASLSSTRLYGQGSAAVAKAIINTGTPIIGKSYSTSIAGKLMPLIRMCRIGVKEFKAVGAAIVSVTDWQDVVLLVFLAFCTPAFNKYRAKVSNNQETTRFGITKVISDVSKVALAVYIVDIVTVIMATLGFPLPQKWKVSAVFTKVAYSGWILREFLYFKCRLLCKFYKVKRDEMGRVEILDRFVNGFAIFIYGLFLVDWLSLELGYALKSIFGLASMFSVAFTLASRDIASNLLAGIWLQASDKAVPGDAVKFGENTSGGLVRMGWLETSLQDGEGAIVKIPNSNLAGQKISNLSRVTKTPIKQTLRFDYSDANKIPELIHAIKQEIMVSCKKLVVDGSRPFRVHFTNYMEDHLEVTVVTHHEISPLGGEFHDNKQELLLAINRAVKKTGVQFAQMVKMEIPGRPASWKVVQHKSYLESDVNGEYSN
ncbi:hypothetical protein MPSEU_000011200 [Mayamaea pseudoterrestris]|nr:hypothetical protein MPSEU_000011200 [Mayamaea pseudoterrestris]